MLETIGKTLNYVLPVLYLGIIYFYYMIYSGRKPRWAKKSSWLLGILLFFSATEIVIRNIVLGTMPLSNAYDAYSFLAFSLLFVYLIIEMGMKEKGSGLFIMFFGFLLQLIALRYLSWEPETNPLLSNPSFAIHASLAIMGYTALSLSAIYAVLYLIQQRNLKSRNLNKLFNQLPALNYLERLTTRSTLVGIILMGVGLIFAHRMARVTIGSYWPDDPKVIMSDAIWVVYLVGYILARALHWRGKRLAYVALVLFALMLVGAGIVIIGSQSFHQFY